MDRSIWDCLENQNGEGLLLTSCGAELQELMRQMDIMVRNKKLEWEAELTTTQDCLTLREQELLHSRTLLDQKHKEVGILKQQLESYESGQKHAVMEYEAQLNQLKSQMKNLKDAHEKMQRHRTKRNQASDDKGRELATELQLVKADLKKHQDLAVQHDKQSSEWDIRKRALQNQLECVDTQKRAMASNYEHAQQQLSIAQSRLKRSNRMVEEVEGRSQSLLKKLEEELANDKELIQRQESLIAELQSKTRELNTARHTATGERYRYQEQADKANCKLKVIDEEVHRLQGALTARESALRASEHEIADLKNQNDNFQATIHTKEKIIEALQVRSPSKKEESDHKQKIAMLEATIESMMKTEKNLREEIKSLDQQLQSSKEEARKLNECVRKNECEKVLVVNDEIKRLRVKLEEMEASHSAQLCGMKADVTTLSSHLHDRDANITRLGDTCAEMEKQLREESQRRDKLDAELQVAAVNLKALREQRISATSDNMGMILTTPSADKSLVEAECQLTSLRKNYGKAVDKLENENQHLKSQVTELKAQLFNKESSFCLMSNAAERDSRDLLPEMKMQGDGQMREICRAYECRIGALESRIHEMQESGSPHHSSTASSSIAIRSTNSGSGSLTPVTTESDSNKMERSQTPTNDFLLPEDPALSFAPSFAGSLNEKQLQNLLGINDEGFDESRIPTIEDFVSEEEKRFDQLESQIDRHIGDMRKAMDLAMEKYMNKS